MAPLFGAGAMSADDVRKTVATLASAADQNTAVLALRSLAGAVQSGGEAVRGAVLEVGGVGVVGRTLLAPTCTEEMCVTGLRLLRALWSDARVAAPAVAALPPRALAPLVAQRSSADVLGELLAALDTLASQAAPIAAAVTDVVLLEALLPLMQRAGPFVLPVVRVLARLTQHTALIDGVVRSGAMGSLVVLWQDVLRDGNEALLFTIAVCFRHFSGKESCQVYVWQAGAVPLLLEALAHESERVRMNALGCIEALCGNTKVQPALVKLGVVDVLLRLWRQDQQLGETAYHALFLLSSNANIKHNIVMLPNVVDMLVCVVAPRGASIEEQEAQIAACKLVACLVESPHAHTAVIGQHMVEALAKCIQSNNVEAQFYAVLAMANLACGQQGCAAVQRHGKKLLLRILREKRGRIQEEAARALVRMPHDVEVKTLLGKMDMDSKSLQAEPQRISVRGAENTVLKIRRTVTEALSYIEQSQAEMCERGLRSLVELSAVADNKERIIAQALGRIMCLALSRVEELQEQALRVLTALLTGRGTSHFISHVVLRGGLTAVARGLIGGKECASAAHELLACIVRMEPRELAERGASGVLLELLREETASALNHACVAALAVLAMHAKHRKAMLSADVLGDVKFVLSVCTQPDKHVTAQVVCEAVRLVARLSMFAPVRQLLFADAELLRLIVEVPIAYEPLERFQMMFMANMAEEARGREMVAGAWHARLVHAARVRSSSLAAVHARRALLYAHAVQPLALADNPSRRCWCAAVVNRGVMWMFGGKRDGSEQSKNVANVYQWSVEDNVWMKRTGNTVPSRRWGHTALSYDGEHVFTFGGRAGRMQSKTENFFLLNTRQGTWLTLPPGPPRAFHAMASDGAGHFYVFGGVHAQTGVHSAEVFEYAVQTRVWTHLPTMQLTDGPAPRCKSRMVCWDGMLYVFGGENDACVFGDLWTYDLGTGKWARVHGDHNADAGDDEDDGGGDGGGDGEGQGKGQGEGGEHARASAAAARVRPRARSGHASVLVGDAWIIVGGVHRDMPAVYRDVWQFDFALREWCCLFAYNRALPGLESPFVHAEGNQLIVCAGVRRRKSPAETQCVSFDGLLQLNVFPVRKFSKFVHTYTSTFSTLLTAIGVDERQLQGAMLSSAGQQLRRLLAGLERHFDEEALNQYIAQRCRAAAVGVNGPLISLVADVMCTCRALQQRGSAVAAVEMRMLLEHVMQQWIVLFDEIADLHAMLVLRWWLAQAIEVMARLCFPISHPSTGNDPAVDTEMHVAYLHESAVMAIHLLMGGYLVGDAVLARSLRHVGARVLPSRRRSSGTGTQFFRELASSSTHLRAGTAEEKSHETRVLHLLEKAVQPLHNLVGHARHAIDSKHPLPSAQGSEARAEGGAEGGASPEARGGGGGSSSVSPPNVAGLSLDIGGSSPQSTASSCTLPSPLPESGLSVSPKRGGFFKRRSSFKKEIHSPSDPAYFFSLRRRVSPKYKPPRIGAPLLPMLQTVCELSPVVADLLEGVDARALRLLLSMERVGGDQENEEAGAVGDDDDEQGSASAGEESGAVFMGFREVFQTPEHAYYEPVRARKERGDAAWYHVLFVRGITSLFAGDVPELDELCEPLGRVLTLTKWVCDHWHNSALAKPEMREPLAHHSARQVAILYHQWLELMAVELPMERGLGRQVWEDMLKLGHEVLQHLCVACMRGLDRSDLCESAVRVLDTLVREAACVVCDWVAYDV